MKNLVILLLMAVSCNVYATDIAQCSNPSGKSYYPELGLVTKKNSGWSDDKITDGLIKLTKTGKDKFDITFVDSTKRIISSEEDGGIVMMLNRGLNSVSFLVVYPRKTAEIFTFLINLSGKSEYIHITSRGGDEIMIAKATLMRGDCEYINFRKLDESAN